MIPQFGTVVADAEYVLRPGGYVVLFDAEQELVIVSTPGGLMLPGGGQDPGESPAAAVVREVMEECGLRMTLGPQIGTADEMVYADTERTYFRKRSTFFVGEALEQVGPGESDYTTLRLSPPEAITRLIHGSQRWAVGEALRCSQRD
jgi:8-oxo-dGTP diphosphatase